MSENRMIEEINKMIEEFQKKANNFQVSKQIEVLVKLKERIQNKG